MSENPIARSLKERAIKVIPGGMYGHQSAANLPAEFPQFFERSLGCHLWDVDGKEYIDYMCAYGTNILGYKDPVVEAAAANQRALCDTATGPTARIVDLAERLTRKVTHADWALFAKNGTDATTICVTLARAGTRRSKILVAKNAYHGAAPWCTPVKSGTLTEERAHLIPYTYNDIESFDAAVNQAGDDLAGVVVSAFKHDVMIDQELPDPTFAKHVRTVCTQKDAALIVDDVRAGFRMALDCSWSKVGVEPDLSAWSKAIANGYPLAAVLGNDRFREACEKIFVTGSFWYSAVPMTAALATLDQLEALDGPRVMDDLGNTLRAGLAEIANSHNIPLRQSGPPAMPLLLFDDDPKFKKAYGWTAEMVKNGVYFHPWHNMFLSCAHTDEDIAKTLDVADSAFTILKQNFEM